MLSQDTVNTFIINTVLVDPIEKIVDKLKNGDFRDCDIKWLDGKMDNFMRFAAETFGIQALVVPGDLHNKPKYMNDYLTRQYITRFSALLQYIKSF